MQFAQVRLVLYNYHIALPQYFFLERKFRHPGTNDTGVFPSGITVGRKWILFGVAQVAIKQTESPINQQLKLCVTVHGL